MSLIKLAVEQRKTGIAGFTQRHPYLSAGIALTGGIAAADMGTRGIMKMVENRGLKQKLMSGVGHKAMEGLKEGALYGGILSAVEPAILHGGLKKKSEVVK